MRRASSSLSSLPPTPTRPSFTSSFSRVTKLPPVSSRLRRLPSSRLSAARARRVVGTFLVPFTHANVALALLDEFDHRVRDPMSGDKLARLSRSVKNGDDRPVVIFLGSSRTGF